MQGTGREEGRAGGRGKERREGEGREEKIEHVILRSKRLLNGSRNRMCFSILSVFVKSVFH